MAVFPSFKLTEKGEELLNRSIGEGKTLTFTKFELGDGNAPSDFRKQTGLVNKFYEFPILNTSIQKDQVLRIKGYFDNKSFSQDKQLKEIGVFVKIEGNETQYLYSYTNAGDTGDIIPSNSRGFYSRTLDVANYIGYATNITFNIEQLRDRYAFNTENEMKVASYLKAGDKVELWGNLVLGDKPTDEYIIQESGEIELSNGLFAKKVSFKYTAQTIEEMQKLALKVGDIVELLGYYTAGDGAGHKRVIAQEDDGSGVLLENGLYANIVHNGEVKFSWLGAKRGYKVITYTYPNNFEHSWEKGDETITQTYLYQGKQVPIYNNSDWQLNLNLLDKFLKLKNVTKVIDGEFVIGSKDDTTAWNEPYTIDINKQDLVLKGFGINESKLIGKCVKIINYTNVELDNFGISGLMYKEGENGESYIEPLKKLFSSGSGIKFLVDNNLLDYNEHQDSNFTKHLLHWSGFWFDNEGTKTISGKCIAKNLYAENSQWGFYFIGDSSIDTRVEDLEITNCSGKNIWWHLFGAKVFDKVIIKDNYLTNCYVGMLVDTSYINEIYFDNNTVINGCNLIKCQVGISKKTYITNNTLKSWDKENKSLGVNQLLEFSSEELVVSNNNITINDLSKKTLSVFINNGYLEEDKGNFKKLNIQIMNNNFYVEKEFEKQISSQEIRMLNLRLGTLETESNHINISNNTVFYKSNMQFILATINGENENTDFVLNNNNLILISTEKEYVYSGYITFSRNYQTKLYKTLSIINNSIKSEQGVTISLSGFKNINIKENSFELVGVTKSRNIMFTGGKVNGIVSDLVNIENNVIEVQPFLNTETPVRTEPLFNLSGGNPKVINFKNNTVNLKYDYNGELIKDTAKIMYSELNNSIIFNVYNNIFHNQCKNIGFTTEQFIIKNPSSVNSTFLNNTFINWGTINVEQLNTPYHINLMEQEGGTTKQDFYTYLDERVAYNNQLQEEEKAKSEAYELLLQENPKLTWEEFEQTYGNTSMMNRRKKRSLVEKIEEPQIPESVVKFMEKYL